MSILRIIYQNLADTANITASTTAQGFSVENLKNTQKTSVHRSTGNTVVYTLNWSTPQQVNAFALPATNLTDGATIQVQGYTGQTEDTLVFNTGAPLQACKGREIVVYGNTSQPTYMDFGFGGATKTSIWLSRTASVSRVVITITNSYPIDCARLVVGKYWASSRQVSRGIEIGFQDSSEITTTRSGNTYEDRKPIQETMRFDLEYINDQDRQELQKIMRSWGSSGLLFVCLFPDNTNPETTQTYSIYGRSSTNNIQYQYYKLYGTSMDLTSW
jgi:hypothetical protein